MLGLVNHSYKKGFRPWLDNRVEDIPENLQAARTDYLVQKLKFEGAEDNLAEVVSSISEVTVERSRLTAQLRERDANNNTLVYPYRSAERKSINDQIEAKGTCLGGTINRTQSRIHSRKIWHLYE